MDCEFFYFNKDNVVVACDSIIGVYPEDDRFVIDCVDGNHYVLSNYTFDEIKKILLRCLY